MIFYYSPPNQLVINRTSFMFGEKRDKIRSRFSNFTEDNQVIELDKDDPTKTVYQRRDIYQNIESSTNFFFLSYGRNDLLNDVEVHHCDQIQIFDVSFNFDTSIDFIAKKIDRYSSSVIKKPGEYVFLDLKIAIINKNEMGAEGNTLGYFYCTSDISHLVI